MIKCGHCSGSHETVADVKDCAFSGTETNIDRSQFPASQRYEEKFVKVDPERDLNKVMSEPVTREGLYRLSRNVRLWGGMNYSKGDLFQVLRGRNSERLYAKLVELPPGGSKARPTLTFVKGMVFQLLPTELVPVEEAEEITRKTGWCVFGHFLTNPVSIARGMGPVCFERYPHLAKNVA